MPNQDAEKREFERFPIGFKIELYAQEGAAQHLETTELQDISSGGVCFFSTCKNIYTIDQRLFLSIHLPGDVDKAYAAMQGEATVVWIGEQKETSPNKPAGSYIGACVDDLLTFNRIVQDQDGEQETDRVPE